MSVYATPAAEVPAPPTITTADGKVWTPAPRSPFESEMFRTYACGTRRATLITRGASRKFVSVSGKRLEVAVGGA